MKGATWSYTNKPKTYCIINSGIQVAQYLDFYVVFCRSLFVHYPHTFDHCIVYKINFKETRMGNRE